MNDRNTVTARGKAMKIVKPTIQGLRNSSTVPRRRQAAAAFALRRSRAATAAT